MRGPATSASSRRRAERRGPVEDHGVQNPCSGEDRLPGRHHGAVEGVGGVVADLPRAPPGVGAVGHPQRAGAAEGGADVVAPRLGDGGRRRDRGVGGDADEVRPRPRDDVDDLVPAAAGGHPAAVADLVREVVQHLGDDAAGRRARRRGAASGSRAWVSQPCWVTSASGANARTSGGDDGVHGAQPVAVAGAGRQRHVDGGALGAGAAGLVREPGAGEQHPAGLVHGDRQDPRVVPEQRLRPVAVVHVDVDVGDLRGAGVEQPLHRRGDVVVDAEAGGPVAEGVVQPAAEVHRVPHLAGPHLVGAVDAGLQHPGAGVVHAGEGRVVGGAETARLVGVVGVLGGVLHRARRSRGRARCRAGRPTRRRRRPPASPAGRTARAGRRGGR